MGDHNEMKTRKYKELKKLSRKLSCSELALSVDFKEGIRIACSMLHNKEHDCDLQVYAVDFLKELRKTHQKAWNSSWEFDALLGYGYDIAWGAYDEQYVAYMRAFKKAPRPAPPQLLVAIAGCCGAPGTQLTKEEAISLLKEAASRELSNRGLQLLRSFYKRLGNTKEQMYWDGVLKETEGKLPPPPSFLTQALEKLEKRTGH